MASFKAKFPVLQELFAKNHQNTNPSGARVSIYSLGFSLVVSQHVAALLSSQAGVNDANKTSHQSIFYPHHCICKTTINYKASQKSSENPSTFWHLHCAPSLERTGQHDVCHSLYLYPAVYLKRCGQTVENHSWAKDTDRSLFYLAP